MVNPIGRKKLLKKKRLFIVIILLVFVFQVAPHLAEYLYFLKYEPITGENVVSTVEELEEKVVENLNQGKEEFVIYTRNITDEQLKNINSHLDGYYGHVDSYSIARRARDDLYQTRFRLSISDNYYAYHYLTEGLNIDDHPDAKRIAKRAKQILEKVIKEGMTDYEKELAIHDFIVTKGEYGYLKGEKEMDSYHSYGILLEGKGVCNSYSESMQLLLSLAGVESKIIVGVADNDHSWNLVKLDGKWYHVDTTWDDPVPNEKGRILHNYFNVPDELIEKTHTWERSRYEKATSYDQNYYAKNRNWCRNYKETKARILELIKERKEDIRLLLTEEQAREYSYNFIVQSKAVRHVKWRTSGEYPCMVLEMSLSY